MRLFRTSQEASRVLGANPIARRAVELLYKNHRHLLLRNPQEALMRARDEAEQQFVKYAVDLSENFDKNDKLHEAMLSDAWRQIRNDEEDEEDDED